MTKKYTLAPTTLDDVWDRFMQKSPDRSIFLHSQYMKNAGCRMGLYHCYNANELRAIVGLVESPDGSAAILDDLIIYSGICFAPASYGQTPVQVISERFEISTFLAGQLAKQYSSIRFALAPTVSDIRPFLWHNYGHENGRYSVDIRYTSFLDISDFANASCLEDVTAYQLATGARRQQIRYAIRDRISTIQMDDISVLIDFYRKTLARQGELVDDIKIERIANLVKSLLDDDLAIMLASYTADAGLGSIVVFAYDENKAYYLFGASDPAFRSTAIGTAILWSGFQELSMRGLREVDLEGVNSPKRGWFKLSFGGTLNPYYQVSY